MRSAARRDLPIPGGLREQYERAAPVREGALARVSPANATLATPARAESDSPNAFFEHLLGPYCGRDTELGVGP